MDGLDSTQLRTLAAVVSEGSFEAAARLLHITPSAVSQRVKALEETVGQVLVRRARPARPRRRAPRCCVSPGNSYSWNGRPWPTRAAPSPAAERGPGSPSS